MADLKFVDQHNMVAYLEKSDDNIEFHQIVDFLSSCSITYALTQIHAIVDGKAIVISESSVRSDLLFDDEDGDSPRCQETTRGTFAQTRSERVLKQPNEPPLTEGHTSGSPYHSHQKSKKLETQLKQKRSRAVIHSSDEEEPSIDFEDSPKQERMIKELDKVEDVNLVSEQGEVHETAKLLKDDDDATLAETLLNIKRSTTKDKGKGIMQENKLPKKIKKREMIQLSIDEELAQKLYAEELAKETARQEQEKYNLEKALELQKKLNKREEYIDKAEVRKNMCMHLKNQGGYKQSYFKGMKYEDIEPIFERAWDQVYTFVPKDSEIEKEFMKRYGFHLQQESSKKQKLDHQTEEEEEDVEAQVDSDQEVEEMKLYMRIVLDEKIAIDAIPLATKPLVIIKYKTVKEGSQYENFTALSSEMLDQTFDRLQNLVSQLEFLEEKLSQKDINQKLLRSLSPEWNTHVVVWRNKADLDTMSMDDLYNNLKVYEPKVKGMSS
nr:hypothetical protein [Tanacetum cinerariifolium]